MASHGVPPPPEAQQTILAALAELTGRPEFNRYLEGIAARFGPQTVPPLPAMDEGDLWP